MRILFVLPLLCLAIGFAVGTPVYAQYEPLIPIPGMGSTLDTEAYIRILYIVAIVIAAFVAVGKLAYAGFKYVASASVSQKTDAKQDIFGAIIGLVIILTAVAILTTINPQISNLAGLRSINVPPPNQPRAESVGDFSETTIVETGTIVQNCRVPEDAADKDSVLRACRETCEGVFNERTEQCFINSNDPNAETNDAERARTESDFGLPEISGKTTFFCRDILTDESLTSAQVRAGCRELCEAVDGSVYHPIGGNNEWCEQPIVE